MQFESDAVFCEINILLFVYTFSMTSSFFSSVVAIHHSSYICFVLVACFSDICFAFLMTPCRSTIHCVPICDFRSADQKLCFFSMYIMKCDQGLLSFY